jgi:hypothetical protein
VTVGILGNEPNLPHFQTKEIIMSNLNDSSKPDGDGYLSSLDNQLWSIHLHILLKWKTHTMFKYERWNFRTGARGHLYWFIPHGTEYSSTIKIWLESELESFKQEDSEVDGANGKEFYPGTGVTICTASPLCGYVEQEQMEAIARDAFNNFMDQWKSRDKE